jgi:caffeoyl-CoA O-methyltransferase
MTSETRPKYAAKRPSVLEPAIEDYIAAHSTRPDAHQEALEAATRAKTGPAWPMQIASDQAVFLEILVRAMGARRAIEIGTFTGYSALAIARGLGAEGHLLCCDISEEWATIARAAWADAGVADRIELRIGPAIDTLRALPPGEQFDFAFIDADKPGYVSYYEEIVVRLRPGGLVLIDDVLQGGTVADPAAVDERVVAIRAVNELVANDPRVVVAMVPIGNGVSIAQKR